MTTMKQLRDDDRQVPTGPVPTMFEAIVRRLMVTAVYNRGTVLLAPHILYTRHDQMYVDALTIERDGAPPKETKLGAFKLDGLGELRLTERTFKRSGLFVEGDPKYDGVTLMAIDRG